jgi:hypothetical protein
MKIWRGALVIVAVPSLLALVGVAPAGATAVGAGIVTAQFTGGLNDGPGGGSIDSLQLTLVGDISAGSTFDGSASTSGLGFFVSEQCGVVCTVPLGGAPITGSGVLGSIDGTCGGPGSTLISAPFSYVLNLVCTVSVSGGAVQTITLRVVLTSVPVPVVNLPSEVPQYVGVFAG